MVSAIIIILLSAVLILLVINLITLKKQQSNEGVSSQDISRLQKYMEEQNRNMRMELTSIVQSSVKSMGDMLGENQQNGARSQADRLTLMEQRLNTFAMENQQKLGEIRETVEKRMEYIQQDNNKRLDQMRDIVDEKLQKTLEEKMTRSFALVNQRLEQVYKGLGEMQNLAVGVGDLKKVLSNVKTRGILGEIQLGAILKEILSPEQYEENVITKKSSRNPVEFAVRLPADGDGVVYLPIDSKFPGDTYANLRDAYNSGSKEDIAAATKALIATVKAEARDIHDKYLDPPATTDFAVLFLPFEGLYAEVINLGLVEALQHDYKVNIAGPSTMAALLNSLQMGFKTLAVQKRSTEVWNVLGAVKTEFDKFADVLVATQQRLEQANSELDKLVGVRTRQIQRKLRGVTKLHDSSQGLLSDETGVDQ